MFRAKRYLIFLTNISQFLETESWHLLSSSECGPAARHKHSAVLHDDAMYVYGGMTDLQERSDCWRWDVHTASWCMLKNKPGPGPLHGHAACRLPSCMLIFGGESGGLATNELWRFHFGTNFWFLLNSTLFAPNSLVFLYCFLIKEEIHFFWHHLAVFTIFLKRIYYLPINSESLKNYKPLKNDFYNHSLYFIMVMVELWIYNTSEIFLISINYRNGNVGEACSSGTKASAKSGKRCSRCFRARDSWQWFG